LYDSATGTTVQIDKIAANSFDFSQDRHDTGERDAFGARIPQSDVSRCSFQFIDSDGSKALQLQAWESNRTRVSLVAVGAGRCVQWYESDRIKISRPSLSGITKGRGDLFDLVIERSGHGRHAIYSNTNLLAHINGVGSSSWQHVSGGVALGYSTEGAATFSWLNPDEQQIDDDTALSGVYVEIVFPLQLDNFSFNFTSEITNLHSQVSLARIEIKAYDFASSLLLSDNNETTTGRKTTTINSSSAQAIYKIRVYPIMTPSGITITDIVAGRFPVLTMNSNLTAWNDA